jgi:hypothetical protein
MQIDSSNVLSEGVQQAEIEMRAMKVVLALLGLVWLGGCTFESSTVLPDVTAAGDQISGFPEDSPFTIEAFDRAKLQYAYFASVKPEKVPGQGIRYVMTFNDNSPMQLVVQARRMSDNNYLIRYFQTEAGKALTMNESGLVFARIEGDTYYVLTGISNQAMLDKIFVGERPLELSTSVVHIETDHQADRISTYFRDHFGEFPKDQDYARIRVAK